ncbi:MAG: hypothetical protein K6E50_05630 [Lachnospiraceae bacterium]|nr:hypothetical protein [Lachnospiraceae bacterium]
MTFTSVSSECRGLILVVCSVILLMYLYVLLRIRLLGRPWKDYVLPGVAALACFALWQMMSMIQEGDLVPSGPVPLALLLPGLVLLLVYAVYLQLRLLGLERRTLSAVSVKEAFDRLPLGLAFYSEEGIPIMVNESMQEISRRLYGKSVSDAAAFWAALRRNTTESLLPEDEALVHGRGGEVYSVKRRILEINGRPVRELTALDIRREHALTRELKNRRIRAGHLNRRLKALMGTIEYVTMNRELLALKRALHDNIGQCILTAKRYLYSPRSVDKERMLSFWRENMRHLINDRQEEWELPYYVISKEADRLGINLQIIGELPDDPKRIPIVDAAISVHIGNVLKHADGTEATVTVTQKDGRYVMVFTNNGRLPDGEIEEKGGLLNLRREVEAAGGEMEISTRPAFEMRITI